MRSLGSTAIQFSSGRTAIKSASPTSSKLRRAQERRDQSLVLPVDPPSTDLIPEAIEPFEPSLPAVIPHDEFGLIDSLPPSDPIRALLSVNAIVVARQVEMMNILLGYEEANKYKLLNPEGETVGFLMEEELGFVSSIKRQVLRTHRAMKATVLDPEGNKILIIRRPFSYINSRIIISIPSPSSELESDETVIGEVSHSPLPSIYETDEMENKGISRMEHLPQKVQLLYFSRWRDGPIRSNRLRIPSVGFQYHQRARRNHRFD